MYVDVDVWVRMRCGQACGCMAVRVSIGRPRPGRRATARWGVILGAETVVCGCVGVRVSMGWVRDMDVWVCRYEKCEWHSGPWPRAGLARRWEQEQLGALGERG